MIPMAHAPYTPEHALLLQSHCACGCSIILSANTEDSVAYVSRLFEGWIEQHRGHGPPSFDGPPMIPRGPRRVPPVG
jgi:hypothetical protein